MIRDLRKKFILVAMLSPMLVLTAIMGVVNFSNYREMLDRADEMTALLEQNDGKFPEEPSRHEQDDTETPPAKPENDEKDKSRFSVETPFETRYFTVTVDENGEVTDCDLDRIPGNLPLQSDGDRRRSKIRLSGLPPGDIEFQDSTGDNDICIASRSGSSLCAGSDLFQDGIPTGGREYPETETLYHRRGPRAQDTTDDHRCKHRGHGNGKRRIPVSRQRTKMAED